MLPLYDLFSDYPICLPRKRNPQADISILISRLSQRIMRADAPLAFSLCYEIKLRSAFSFLCHVAFR